MYIYIQHIYIYIQTNKKKKKQYLKEKEKLKPKHFSREIQMIKTRRKKMKMRRTVNFIKLGLTFNVKYHVNQTLVTDWI